jgi:hypothetical protein
MPWWSPSVKDWRPHTRGRPRCECSRIGLGEELQAEGLLEGRAIDALGPGPVEGAHGGKPAQPAAGKPALEAAAGPLLLFGAGEVLEELGGTPAP